MIKRLYENVLREHLATNRQMAFVGGPRQVGKTTLAQMLASRGGYRNWDVSETRDVVLRGGTMTFGQSLGLDGALEPRTVVLDEFHKYPRWKSFIKGFYDAFSEKHHIVLTGSARLSMYQRGGDSLMGRYFNYTVHPFSVGELLNPELDLSRPVRPPEDPGREAIPALLEYGGFPDPFVKQSKRFSNRWNGTRMDQLFREDIRDLTAVRDTVLVKSFAEMLSGQIGQIMNLSRFAGPLGVSVDTVTRWYSLLESLFYCFSIRPWSRNIGNALKKAPKVYLYDWSQVVDLGARNENFIASHLFKAVSLWNELGLGRFALRYLRDKAGHEVDFVVVRDNAPWFLVEAKTSENRDLSQNLAYFQRLTKAESAFQVCMDMPFIGRDCFAEKAPVKVPASTFLSQLV